MCPPDKYNRLGSVVHPLFSGSVNMCNIVSGIQLVVLCDGFLPSEASPVIGRVCFTFSSSRRYNRSMMLYLKISGSVLSDY